MAADTLNRFLGEISAILREQNGQRLQQYLVIEPPFAEIYNTLITEVRRTFPKDQEEALESRCNDLLPEARDGVDGSSSWTAFTKFMVAYFGFLRDVDVSNLLDTYNLLSDLLQKANSALTHPSLGLVILPTVVSYSRMLSRLAIGLDKQPHLIAHLVQRPAGEEGSTRETLPERAANILRQAFVTCLNDRSGTSSSGTSRDGKPEGKKRGIYTIANLCLKILFSCRKIRGASQIFENIYNQSPPLDAYPRSERVTYLYYLGRFLWSNGHFLRARRALEAAYNLCHAKGMKQRRLILVFLIATNLVSARFPTASLLSRPEAHGMREVFEPLCRAIIKGDICTFRRLLTPGSSGYEWFAFFGIDLPLRNRCEVLVWRSLVRRAFLIHGDQGDPDARKAPTLDLNDLVTLWQWQERTHLTTLAGTGLDTYVDPEFEGIDGMGPSDEDDHTLPDMTSVVSIMSSLIHQELLNGYLSFKQQKFAIQGARQKGALAAGFPLMSKAIEAKSDSEVPGWKLVGSGPFQRPQFGAGSVVNLSGAKPVGVS